MQVARKISKNNGGIFFSNWCSTAKVALHPFDQFYCQQKGATCHVIWKCQIAWKVALVWTGGFYNFFFSNFPHFFYEIEASPKIISRITAISSHNFKLLQMAPQLHCDFAANCLKKELLLGDSIACCDLPQSQNRSAIGVPLEVIALQTHPAFCSHLKLRGGITAILPTIMWECSLKNALKNYKNKCIF